MFTFPEAELPAKMDISVTLVFSEVDQVSNRSCHLMQLSGCINETVRAETGPIVVGIMMFLVISQRAKKLSAFLSKRARETNQGHSLPPCVAKVLPRLK
jgi:hypothetical protein